MDKRASHLLLAAGILFGGLLCLPRDAVADSSPGDTASEEIDQAAARGSIYSPWNGDLWRAAGPEMKAYVCKHASHRPSWCRRQASELDVYPAPEPEIFGPNFTADDTRWLRLLAEDDPSSYSPGDVAFIERRASQEGDPKAMEVLGFLYATGTAAPRDPVTAYKWYGRAYMAGELQVKPNMDLLWTTINSNHRHAVAELQAFFAQ